MSAYFSNRNDWLVSLQDFAASSQYSKRFSRSRLQSGITSEEFIFNEYSFYKLFKHACSKGEFEILSAKKRSISSQKGKREFFGFEIFETFIYRHVARLLRNDLESQISNRVFGRIAKGTDAAVADFKKYIELSKGTQLWIIRRDLKDFGMSIPHQPLLIRLSRLLNVSSKDLLLIESLIKINYKDATDQEYQNLHGTPTGTQLQQLINNFYLSEIDNLMETQADYYIRYGDDILVAANSLNRMQELKHELDSKIEEAGLVINVQKSQEFEFLEDKQHTQGSLQVSYLGREIDRSGRVLISEKNFDKLKKDIEQQLKKTALLLKGLEKQERIKILCQSARKLVGAQYFNSSSVSTTQLLKIQSDETLFKFDSWLALKVLQLGLQKGFKKSNFRFYTITKLRKLGLPNVARWRQL